MLSVESESVTGKILILSDSAAPVLQPSQVSHYVTDGAQRPQTHMGLFKQYNLGPNKHSQFKTQFSHLSLAFQLNELNISQETPDQTFCP